MAKTQLKVLKNIGTNDIKRGFPKAMEGDVITVKDEALAEKMVRCGMAEPLGESEEVVAEAEESEVHDLTVEEAVERINSMRKAEKLQHIINSDPRVGVKSAAQKRLDSLPK